MARSKTWQTKGGFAREDSDDELGYDDHPWEWIYQDGNEQDKSRPDHSNEDDQPPNNSTSRKRKATAISEAARTSSRTIVGAKMGSFSVKIGDAILLRSPEEGKDWAGLICAFSSVNEDDESEMCTHIMWFCSREELESSGLSATGSSAATSGRKKARQLPDAMLNESYITTDFNMNPLTAINGKAHVMGYQEYLKAYPGGQTPKGKAAANKWSKTIMCRRGVKQRNLRFTEEMEWRDVYTGAADLLGLLDWVREHTKGMKRKVEDTEYNVKAQAKGQTDDDANDVDMGPQTPKKKRKTTTSAASTPKSSVNSASKFTTPTSKRIMIKKPLEITPLGTRFLSPSQNNAIASPYSQARSTLHVSHVPASLPCRANEYDTVYSHLHSAITDGTGSCIYISGTPGTGKTATVREVVSQLSLSVLNDELDDFNFVEINGMKVTEPAQAYTLLWESLKGDRVSPSNALNLLEHEFSHPSPRRIPCVVLMDELDQLVTKSQSVMYNFFNWPSLRHSRLIVLAVANTMDLPERTLSNKISSRLGLIRITFPGYTHAQLMEIISSRLESVGSTNGAARGGGIVDKDAVQFAARKVAAVSGDARRALDICRRAVEIAEQQATEIRQKQRQNEKTGHVEDEEEEEEDQITATTPSKTGRNSKSNHIKENIPSKQTTTIMIGAKVQQPHVTISTIKQAINEAISNPTSQHLRSLPLASKLFLAGLLARTRRTGVSSETTLDDVLYEAKLIALADVNEHAIVQRFLLDGGNISASNKNRGGNEANKKKHFNAPPRVLGMDSAAMELFDAGIVSLDGRAKAGERVGKVRLRIGEEVVIGALMDDDEVRGMGFSS